VKKNREIFTHFRVKYFIVHLYMQNIQLRLHIGLIRDIYGYTKCAETAQIRKLVLWLRWR